MKFGKTFCIGLIRARLIDLSFSTGICHEFVIVPRNSYSFIANKKCLKIKSSQRNTRLMIIIMGNRHCSGEENGLIRATESTELCSVISVLNTSELLVFQT